MDSEGSMILQVVKSKQVENRDFFREMMKITLPVTFQCLFQSSLSVIDQIMAGQLGSTSIAGIGLGGKFASLATVTISAVVTEAAILIAQYHGAKNEKQENASFFLNMYISMLIAALFCALSIFLPGQIMSLYSRDAATIVASADYLRIIGVGFVPMAVTLMISAYLRSIGYARYPMYTSVLAVISNTALNYVLIFGKFGFPEMGLKGAALATTIARVGEMLLISGCLLSIRKKEGRHLYFRVRPDKEFLKKISMVLLPILACEFLWSLGENGYAVIYGRIGTEACAAITLTYPVQTLMIGAFSGIAAAAGIMIGKRLGGGKYQEAYEKSKVFAAVSLLGTVLLSFFLILLGKYYVRLFDVSESVRQMTMSILYVYAFLAPVKVLNMVFGGGVLRSGGNTRYTLFIDIIGTWVFGLPLGILAAFVFGFPIHWVYLFLSLEEVVRLILSVVVFRKRKWMRNITEE